MTVKLSTRGRYGVHAMYDLALHVDDGPQAVKAIAERQHIPESYLEQLVAALRKDGLITSVRGAQGGYRLSRPAEEITLGDVLRSLEGGLSLVDCLDGEDACERSCSCPVRAVWRRVRDGLTAVVDSITLKDIVRDAIALNLQEE